MGHAVSHEPVRTEFFCMLCMEYFKTFRKLEKHMERFHDELRQENRGIKRGGLKDSDEHIRKRNKIMDNEVEMGGDGYLNQENESDGDIDSNNDSEDNDGDDGNDDDRDDIKYMRGFGVIKFVDDKIYEQADPKLDLEDEDIEIDGDVYKLRGSIYGNGGHTLYMINGMLFEECEDTGTDEDIGTDEDTGTDEVMNWDGKCFKRFKLGWEEKLEGDKKELEGDKKELEDYLELANCKVCELILTHIKSLKGNFSEYIEHASDHDIDQIQYCCFVLMDGCCP